MDCIGWSKVVQDPCLKMIIILYRRAATWHTGITHKSIRTGLSVEIIRFPMETDGLQARIIASFRVIVSSKHANLTARKVN